ncbi:MAG: alpha/beta hydrolase [Gammaproteobacteria bacterium]|nr:alpha/beta hydrolase [Gammaproteobacteria bacterium]
MPSHKEISYLGTTFFSIKNGLINLGWISFDSKEIENQIFPPAPPYKIENIFNGLEGPAKKIYKLILSTRTALTDSKYALVAALRKDVARAPDLSLLNMEAIKEIKEQTCLTRDFVTSSEGHNIELFVYAPKGQEMNNKLSTILYLHGGGWSIGSPENYDLTNRKLALTVNTRVICLRYRLAPENPYPAGFDDCCFIYTYLRKNRKLNNIVWNNNKIIIAGDSVGGTFAASLVLMKV